MATNYRQPGSVLTLVAPAGGVVSGSFYVFGTLVVCAMVTAAEGESFAGQICGVFAVTKAASQAWTEGAAVYITSGGVFTTSSGGNTAAGKSVGIVGAGAGEIEGLVLLNGLPAAAI